MAAKKVASALHVLTSDGIVGCNEWLDNTAFEALIADYFTGSGDDSSEESDGDDTGNVISVIQLLKHVNLSIGVLLTGLTHVEDENTANDGQDDMETDFSNGEV